MITLFRSKETSRPTIPFTYGYSRNSAFGISQNDVSRRELLKAYTSWVFTCVTIRAEAQGKVRFRVYTENAKGEKVFLPASHPAQQVLDAPNPYMSKFVFQFLVSAFLDLVGDAFAYIARDSMNIPRQLWLLPPDKVKAIPGETADRLIDTYVLDWGAGKSYTFDADEILHIKQPNPNSFITGFSTTEAAAYIVDINIAQKRWQRNFYDKEAMPDAVFKHPQKIATDAKEEFLQKWLDWFSGTDKKRRVAFLDQGIEFEPISINPSELQHNQEALRVRNEVFGMYRVPLSKAGLDESVTARATAETLNFAFYSDVIEPRTVLIEDQITLDLLAPYWSGQGIRTTHDNIIPEDVERQARIDKAQIEAGVKTVNQIRKRNGDDAVRGGDEALVGRGLVPLSQLVDDGQTKE